MVPLPGENASCRVATAPETRFPGLQDCDVVVVGAGMFIGIDDPTHSIRTGRDRNGDTQSLVDDVSQIAPGEGGVILRDDEKIAVWRDDNGGLHALSASCMHKGCTVTWNNADRTWDCPCHGSMFEADGTVIHGPARIVRTRLSVQA